MLSRALNEYNGAKVSQNYFNFKLFLRELQLPVQKECQNFLVKILCKERDLIAVL